MAKLKFELNRAGVRDFMRSPEMMKVCQDAADQALRTLGAGYESDAHTGKNRVNVAVGAATIRARRENLKNNTILKAVENVKI